MLFVAVQLVMDLSVPVNTSHVFAVMEISIMLNQQHHHYSNGINYEKDCQIISNLLNLSMEKRIRVISTNYDLRQFGWWICFCIHLQDINEPVLQLIKKYIYYI